jgi:TadE-like protein
VAADFHLYCEPEPDAKLMRTEPTIRVLTSRVAKRLSRLTSDCASQIAEFAISAPLLIVFTVGVFDFGGAYNLKQKIVSAAEEGAITAANQTTFDLNQANPASNQAVLNAVFNHLVDEKVIVSGDCTVAGATSSQTGLTWTYTITGCPDTVTVIINRGNVFAAGTTKVVGGDVSVGYPYQWRFGSVIKLIAPGAAAPQSQLTADATISNQS